MRFFIAGLATETNSFSPIPSGALAFSLDHVRRVRAGEIAPPKDEMLAVFHELCSTDGHEVVQGIAAGAEPEPRSCAPSMRNCAT